MKIGNICLSIIVTGLFCTANSFATDKAHWGYMGPIGPEHWGQLDESFSACSSGKNQSPIDLSAMIESDLAPIAINYKAEGNEILNNGHSIQINYQPGSTLSVDGRTFELKQFHFHSPSENTIEGRSFPLEAHFVHTDTKGNIAVLAVLYNEGKENAELAKAWAHMPVKPEEQTSLPENIDANLLLPRQQDYYRFNGSLTTPPCTEGVWWLVMKSINTVSKDQIEKFTSAMHHPNNRPVQPINARMVLQ